MKRCLACSTAYDGGGWRCPACGHEPGFSDGIVLHAPDLAQGDGTDADYPIDDLVNAERSHFWFRNRAALIASVLTAHFPGARSFLEIGAGAGGVLLSIQDRPGSIRLTGSELLLRALREARKRLADVELIQMDARRIPFVSEFDAIGAFDVIEHIDDDGAVLGQMREALRPGGGLVVTVPQHRWLWSAFDEFSGHRRRYTRGELITKIEAAGFELVRITSFTSFVLPILAAARLRRRNRRIDFARELAIPNMLNQLLLRVGQVERAAIRAGVSFPAGGSLLAVGVRR